jgi:hypothetical protein
MPLGTAKHLIWKTEEKLVKFSVTTFACFSLRYFFYETVRTHRGTAAYILVSIQLQRESNAMI